jgi:hypothetical protein
MDSPLGNDIHHISNEIPVKILKPSLTPAILDEFFLLLVGFTLIFTGILSGIIMKELFILFVLTGAGIIVVLGEILKLLKISSREYRFYKDRIVWFEKFITIKKVTIFYSEITDIGIIRDIKDRLCGTGTLAINTAGLKEYKFTKEDSESDRKEPYEVLLKYLKNPEEMKDFIEIQMKKV